jgi:hypothetical protein
VGGAWEFPALPRLVRQLFSSTKLRQRKIIFRSHAAGEFGSLSYMECDAEIDEVASSVTVTVKT